MHKQHKTTSLLQGEKMIKKEENGMIYKNTPP
jgi:hypothetical protein